MKKIHKILILFSLIGVACCLYIFWGERSSPEVEKNKMAKGLSILITQEILKNHPLTLVQLSSLRPTQEMILPGKIQKDPTQTAIVTPRVAGRITKVLVHESDKVSPNQVLAIVQSTQVAQVQAAHIKTFLQYNLEKKQMERSKDLYEHQIISLKEFEIAQTEYESIKTEWNVSRLYLKNFNFTDFEIKNLENKKIHTGELAIKSPVEGIVIESAVALGQSVGTEDILFSIGKVNQIWIVLDVYEKDLPYISLGMSAELLIPGQQETPLKAKAKVIRISHEIDATTRSANVWLETTQEGLDNQASRQFRFGQAISARLEGVHPSSEGLLQVLPVESVHRIEGRPTVFVQVAPLEYQAKNVEINWSSEKWIEIKSGISPEDKVASTNSFILKSEYLKN